MYTKVFRLTLGFTILFVISCNPVQEPKEEIKYYANLAGIISPYLEYKGRGEVSADHALKIKHYQFTYVNGQLQRIAFFDQSKPSCNSYFEAHLVEYQYESSTLTRSYYGKQHEKSTFWRHYYLGNNLHKEVFLLDVDGKKTSLSLFDSLNQRAATGLGSYQFKFETINNQQFIQTQHKKDGTSHFLTAYFPFDRSRITINELGFLYSIENVDNLGNITVDSNAGYAKVIFDFDKHGNEMGWSFHDESDKLVNRKSRYGMDYGFAKVVYNFDWIEKEQGKYSSFEEKYFDKEDTPIANNQGVHEIEYSLDEQTEGIKEIAYFGTKGDAVDHGVYRYHRILFSTTDGERQSQTFSATGKPIY